MSSSWQWTHVWIPHFCDVCILTRNSEDTNPKGTMKCHPEQQASEGGISDQNQVLAALLKILQNLGKLPSPAYCI